MKITVPGTGAAEPSFRNGTDLIADTVEFHLPDGNALRGAPVEEARLHAAVDRERGGPRVMVNGPIVKANGEPGVRLMFARRTATEDEVAAMAAAFPTVIEDRRAKAKAKYEATLRDIAEDEEAGVAYLTALLTD